MIDTCFFLLKNLVENSGGTLTNLNVQIKPLEGFNFEDNSTIKGLVKGLDINKYLTDPRCLDCSNLTTKNTEFTPGIWTTALESSLSKVVEGVTYYWIPTSTDKEGNGVFINLYTNCQITNTLTTREERIPIYPNGEFISYQPGFVGNKVAIVYKLTKETLEPIYIFNKNQDLLPRTSWKEQFDSEDNNSSLEELSISLLYLIKSNYASKEENTLKFLDRCDLDIYLKKVVSKTTEKLLSFVDYYSTNNRYGSIPYYLKTFSKVNQIYNDDFYLNDYISFLAAEENTIAYQSYNLDWKTPYTENETVTSKVDIPTYNLSTASEELIDEFIFYGNLSTSRYSQPLTKDHQYKLEISGVINDGSVSYDPAYYSTAGDFSDATLLSPTLGNGLFISDIGFFEGNETYNVEHTYTKEITGTGEAIVFTWFENNEFNLDNVANNSGSFTVKIYKLSYELTVEDTEQILKTETIYNSNLTVNTYAEVKYYRNNCLEDSCYEIVKNDRQTSREVLNKGVAWFLIFLIEYSIQFNEDYTDEIEVLTNYLTKQITRDKLITKGWTHSELLQKSVVIEELDLYTNVVTLIAFAKAYGINYNTHYLYLAATLNKGIIDNFFLDKRLYYKDNVEDLLASLLYGYSMKKRDIVEQSLSYIKPRLNTTLFSEEPNDFNLVELPTTENVSNTILLDLLIDLDYITTIEESYKQYYLNNISLSYVSRCLSYSSLIEEVTIPSEEIEITNHYQSYLIEFIKELPLDFGWFSLEALVNGNLFSILSSIFNTVGALFGRTFTDKRSSFYNQELPKRLEKLEQEKGITKLRGMTLRDFKELLFSYLNVGSKVKINNLLNWFFLKNELVHVSDRLTVLNDIKTVGKLEVGHSYLQGLDRYTNNSFEIITYNHIKRVILDIVKKQISLGFKWKIVENLFSAFNIYRKKDDFIICSFVSEEIGNKQLLINCGYTEEQVNNFFSNIEFYLLELNYSPEEVNNLKWDLRSEIDNICSNLSTVLV